MEMRRLTILSCLTALLMAATGCDEQSAGPPDPGCGAGERLDVPGGASYCLYTNAIIEDGFYCPADAPLLSSFEQGAVCGPGGGAPLPGDVVQRAEGLGMGGPIATEPGPSGERSVTSATLDSFCAGLADRVGERVRVEASAVVFLSVCPSGPACADPTAPAAGEAPCCAEACRETPEIECGGGSIVELRGAPTKAWSDAQGAPSTQDPPPADRLDAIRAISSSLGCAGQECYLECTHDFDRVTAYRGRLAATQPGPGGQPPAHPYEIVVDQVIATP